MAAAYNAYYREETDRILGLLEQQIPGPGQTDLRGFESLYLLGRLQRAVRRPKIISPANVNAIAFEPNSLCTPPIPDHAPLGPLGNDTKTQNPTRYGDW